MNSTLVPALSSDSNNNNSYHNSEIIEDILKYGNDLLQTSIQGTRLESEDSRLRIDTFKHNIRYKNVNNQNAPFCPIARYAKQKDIMIVYDYGGLTHKLSWINYRIHEKLLFIDEGCTINICSGHFLSVLLRILLIKLAHEYQLDGVVSHGWLSSGQNAAIIKISEEETLKIPWSTKLLTKYLDFHYFYTDTTQPPEYRLNLYKTYHIYPNNNLKLKQEYINSIPNEIKKKIKKFRKLGGKENQINTVFVIPCREEEYPSWEKLLERKTKLKNTLDVILGEKLFKGNIERCIPVRNSTGSKARSSGRGTKKATRRTGSKRSTGSNKRTGRSSGRGSIKIAVSPIKIKPYGLPRKSLNKKKSKLPSISPIKTDTS
jgi:hypothetical protein